MRQFGLKLFIAAVVPACFATSAYASSVSDSQSQANTLVTSTATPAASSTTASIIAGGVANAINPGVGVPTPTVGGVTYFDSRSMSGVSAGGMQKKAGFWVQGGYTTIDNSDVGGEFDGNVTNLVAGLDYKVNDKAVVGVSLGYENIDITTTFNTGTFEGEGLTIAPYGGIVFQNDVILDAMVGVSRINYDTSNTNRTVTGSFDATRYMGSLNVSKRFASKKFTVTPKAGVLQVREKQDAFTDSAGTASPSNTVNLGRASIGGTVALNNEKFSPYVRAMAEYDYKKGAAADLGNGRVASNDKFGVNAAVGLNMNLSDRFNFNVEAVSSSNFRENLDVYGISGRLRYDF